MLPEGRYRWTASPPTGTSVDDRLTGAGRWYMNLIEPVGKAVGTVAIAPIVLVMGLLGQPRLVGLERVQERYVGRL